MPLRAAKDIIRFVFQGSTVILADPVFALIDIGCGNRCFFGNTLRYAGFTMACIDTTFEDQSLRRLGGTYSALGMKSRYNIEKFDQGITRDARNIIAVKRKFGLWLFAQTTLKEYQKLGRNFGEF